jgi:hypothetical protein
VQGVNVVGTGTASSPVTVNWQQSQGGADFCSSYADVVRDGVSWGQGRLGPVTFRGSAVYAASITMPSGGGSFTADVAEWADPPTARQVTLSRSACDFRASDPTGQNGPFMVRFGTQGAGVSGSTGGALSAGQTYYINIRNWTPDFPNGSCFGAHCNFVMDFHWQ